MQLYRGENMLAIYTMKRWILCGSAVFLALAAVAGIAAYRTHTEPDSASIF